MTTRQFLIAAVTLVTTLTLWGCNAVSHKGHGDSDSSHAHSHRMTSSRSEIGTQQMMALDLRRATGLDSIMPALNQASVVFVGEQHDNYGHHLAQLEIIQRLHAEHGKIAIGMEMFQQPFQAQIDAYLDGEISEIEFLRSTQWYDRWQFDYRLYQPIIEFAREHSIPVVALNVDRDIISSVSRAGIEGLSEEQRSAIPAEIDRSDAAYAQRLKAIFAMHPNFEQKRFEYFVESQLVWDETMAQRAVDYLQQQPDHKLVVLAGSGHLMYGSGIPNRVTRRLPLDSAVVLPGTNLQIEPEMADFLIYPPEATLPKRGLMGILMEASDKGVVVMKVFPGSSAEQAGMKQGDVIDRIDGEAVASTTDVRLLMLNRRPGDEIDLVLTRKKMLFGETILQLNLTLGD